MCDVAKQLVPAHGMILCEVAQRTEHSPVRVIVAGQVYQAAKVLLRAALDQQLTGRLPKDVNVVVEERRME